MTHFQKFTRILIATMIGAALALVLPAAPPAHAARLRNCVGVIGSPVACYEMVWADGVQLRMTFANLRYAGSTPGDRVDNLYVMAPQTDTPQGTAPSFLHDHVVGDVPPQNHGDYRVHLHAYFVFCSAEGMASGGCVPTMTSIQGMGTVPLARTVNGQMLTSVEPIESAANSGLITLIDTGAVIVATINPGQ
jgi:hypothetical protein